MRFKTKIGLIGLCMIILLGIIGGGIYALLSKNTTSTSRHQTPLPKLKENLAKKLEPRLIWKKEFDGKIIDIIVPKLPRIRKKGEFPIVAVQVEKKTGEVNVWGEPEDTSETKIIFFDKKGKETIWEKKLIYIPWKTGEGAIISNDGRYILTCKMKSEFFGDFAYATQKGDMLWEKKNVEGVVHEISPFGNVIVLCRTTDEYGMCFYNKKGEKMNKYSEFICDLATEGFSEDEEFCCYQLVEKDKGGESIVLFNKKGWILWRYDFCDKHSTHNLLISSHGEIIALVRSSYEDIYIYIYNNQGNLLRKRAWKILFTPDKRKVVFTIKDIVLSSTGRYLLIRFTDSLSLVESVTCKELFSIRLTGVEKCFISPDGNFTFVVCNDSSQGEKLLIINKRGKIIFEQQYSHQSLVDIKFIDNEAYLISIKDKRELLVSKLNL